MHGMDSGAMALVALNERKIGRAASSNRSRAERRRLASEGRAEPIPAQGASEPHSADMSRSRAAAIAAIVAAAIALRVWRLDHGLPDLLEEALPLKTALGMFRARGAIDWNPHAFNYPSLAIYLHLMAQLATIAVGKLAGAWNSVADYLLLCEVAPGPAVLVARALDVMFDAVTIVCVARVGERLRPGAGLLAAALCARAPRR
jgi:hypothetical protein